MNHDFSKRLADIIGQDEVKKVEYFASISGQIIEARHHQKISQQGLADAIGVAKSTIARIEGGLTHPTSLTLLKISEVLNIPIVIDGSKHKDKKDGGYELK
ncbi:helix-turn-helix domain-containing protein [Jeotgalibacillus salarius]|uniref:XRE family transcriptional regulator n=1 Tax=Jeotgalibacillus salarius TaxID=546023 RepID=A0A4Y8LAS5_9BACL|nr:helix-turn-helix transcriptional regulator [Jeotgalibacillus salarius]TFD99421.1 XRE family transcriptional regulator [Jeotgalibacillus salarius]